MTLPILETPAANELQRPKPALKVKTLRQWIHNLPTADTRKTVNAFIMQLETMNASRYSPQERFALLDTLRPVARPLLITLDKHIKQASVPLSQKNIQTYNYIQSILANMAMGYKLVINEMLLSDKPRREHDEIILVESIYNAIQYLGRQILEAYQVYNEEPVNAWLTLHQLYAYAREHEIEQNPVDDPYPDFSLPVHYTIDLVYKRILLLSLSLPHQLMRDEAGDLYYLFSAWTNDCHLLPLPAKGSDITGEFVLEPDKDHPPVFIHKEMKWNNQDALLIDIDDARKRLDKHIQNFLHHQDSLLDEESNTLKHRRQRDMLLRLAQAWYGLTGRQVPRIEHPVGIKLATGLNASHHFLSEKQEFTPETDEFVLRYFDDKDTPAAMMATALETAHDKDTYHLKHDYLAQSWEQYNFNNTGIAVHADANVKNNAKVGELVSYCRAENADCKYWNVGVIRWVNAITDKPLEMGIMNIANSAIAAAVKASKGTGFGTDYFRSLLIPKHVSVRQERSIIVPSTIYDIDTVLTVNVRRRIFYIRLTRMLLTTTSFSQFSFDVLENAPVDADQLLFG